MRKRICPYCDQEIKGIYCRGCRRFVRNPLVMDVDYYLNERHPASEEHCQYHGDLVTGETKASRKAEKRSGQDPESSGTGGKAQKRSGNGTESSRAARKAEKGSGSGTESSRTVRKEEKGSKTRPETLSRPGEKKRLSPVKIILVIFGIWMLLSFAAPLLFLIGNVTETVTGFGEAVPEPAVEAYQEEPESGTDPEDMAEEVFPEMEELSDEEVMEAGIPCNSYGHLSLETADGEELRAELLRLAEEAGFGIRLQSWDSHNWRQGEYTYYNTSYRYSLTRDGQDLGTIGLDFDTADGSLHTILFSVSELESAHQATDIGLKLLASFGGVQGDMDGREFFDTARQECAGGNMVQILEGMETFAGYTAAYDPAYYMYSSFIPDFFLDPEAV